MATTRCPTSAERLTYVKTKIIATVGPASESPEMLRNLVHSGVDVFRLNFAHSPHEWLERTVLAIRKISEEERRPIGILGDLSGPKIRLESLVENPTRCEPGARFEFVRQKEGRTPQQLTCTYEPLVDDLRVNDRVLLADGTVSMVVKETHRDEGRVVCEVEQGGEIRSRQGVNLPGAVLSTPSLTEKDLDDLAWALKHEVDFIGLSFVRSPDDVQHLRNSIAALNPGYEPLIVAKIEKMEAVGQLEKILELTDVVMVARGDLGVEVDLALVPIFQKRIIKVCNQHRIPVITATQMLDSMEHNRRPTRAEATDVANAVLDGSDAIMLSGETAVGEYPVDAVATMSRIAYEAERFVPGLPHADPHSQPRSRALAVTEAVTTGASRAAEHLSADLIVVATRSGKTAMALSRQRSAVPILGMSDLPTTARRMTLFWGVTPMQAQLSDASPQDMLKFAVDWGRKEKVLQSGSKLVLICSSNWSAAGHDMMLVHAVP